MAGDGTAMARDARAGSFGVPTARGHLFVEPTHPEQASVVAKTGERVCFHFAGDFARPWRGD